MLTRVLSLINLLICVESIKVSTPLGEVLGSVTNHPVSVFTGIRYAEAPVGDLRFRLPRSPVSWNSTLNATEYGSACYQVPVASVILDQVFKQSEDCLFLDIYVDGNQSDTGVRMPVMVYIHGGSFILGSSSMYNMTDFVAGRGIVAVVIQYRLGLMGFSQSPDDETIPANIGLHDQVAALKWVKSYIGYFGGDGDSITLAGESAGAVSVVYHLVSPLSAGLFNRAIIQSGAQSTIPVGSREKVSNLMKGLIERSKCNTTSLDAYECLRRLPAKKLNFALSMMRLEFDPNPFSSTVSFTPSLDTRFFDNRDPVESVMKRNFTNKIDSLLIGHTGNEGALFLSFKSSSLFPLFDDSLEDFKTIDQMNNSITEMPEYFRDDYKNILNLAFDGSCRMNTSKLFNKMGKILGDQRMACPQFDLIESLTKFHNETRVYYFHYVYKREDRVFMPYITEALHSDELPFVFGKVLKKVDEYSPEEIQLSERLVDNWTNFVKTGKINDINWNAIEVTPQSLVYNHIAFVRASRPDYRTGPPDNYCSEIERTFETPRPINEPAK